MRKVISRSVSASLAQRWFVFLCLPKASDSVHTQFSLSSATTTLDSNKYISYQTNQLTWFCVFVTFFHFFFTRLRYSDGSTGTRREATHINSLNHSVTNGFCVLWWYSITKSLLVAEGILIAEILWMITFVLVDGGCPRGVMVKAMNCGIVVREFVLQSRYYVHFRANTLGKGRNPLILPPAMGK